jgi:hypothetical protein
VERSNSHVILSFTKAYYLNGLLNDSAEATVYLGCSTYIEHAPPLAHYTTAASSEAVSFTKEFGTPGTYQLDTLLVLAPGVGCRNRWRSRIATDTLTVGQPAHPGEAACI